MTNQEVGSHDNEKDVTTLKTSKAKPRKKASGRGPGRPPGARNKTKVPGLEKVTPAGLCDIIKACREHGVTELCYSGLRIVFEGYRPEPAENPQTPVQVDQPVESELERDKLREELDGIDDDFEYLKLTDPEAFEQLQLTGEAEA